MTDPFFSEHRRLLNAVVFVGVVSVVVLFPKRAGDYPHSLENVRDTQTETAAKSSESTDNQKNSPNDDSSGETIPSGKAGGARRSPKNSGGDRTTVDARSQRETPPPDAKAIWNWESSIPGLLTFRGNGTRTYYGRGKVPATAPSIAWTYPKSGGMCRSSSDGSGARVWCGAGWTGQPAVFPRDGRLWLVFNGYDGAIHFVDAKTGENILEPFKTGDIIKGSVTIDPDGYPLVYSGSRDNYFRVLSIDDPDGSGRAKELWRLSATAVSPTLWNNDWDGSALVANDYLLEGGENSQFHVAKLNRSYSADGHVEVAPKLVFHTPSWDEEVIRDLRGNRAREMSIENSVALRQGVAYFSNSGGLVQGWDLSKLHLGQAPTRTFRFWTGDDTDASVVIDSEGFLYVAVENERGNARSAEVGQLVKLDPTVPNDPIVWSFHDPAPRPGGIWSTPALAGSVVITTTDAGGVYGIDRNDGTVLWNFKLPGPVWQSPVIVDNVLVQGDCAGVLHAYDLTDPRALPQELWNITLGGCIEATPAVWDGSIYVATRGGKMFAIR